MPLTLTVTEDVMPKDSLSTAIGQITDAFLKHHGLSDNALMRRNVTAHVHVLPAGAAFAGGEPVSGAWIEWKVPSFALVDRDVQKKFFAEATQIVHDLSGQTLPKAQIWANALHAVDGSWNLNGVAMSNAELGAALAG